jgi:hypothetical protein
MAARLAGIGPFWWGIRPGEGWRRKRSLPSTGLWPQTVGKMPVGGRLAAPREHGRGGLRSGGAPVWEATRLARGGWGGHVGLLGGTGPRQTAPEEGGAREQAHGQDAGVQRSADRTGRSLSGSARCSALRAGVAMGHGFNATVRRPPRPACTRDRLWTSGHLGAVRRGKCGSRSKDGRREGDHGPDLEAMGSEPHGR